MADTIETIKLEPGRGVVKQDLSDWYDGTPLEFRVIGNSGPTRISLADTPSADPGDPGYHGHFDPVDNTERYSIGEDATPNVQEGSTLHYTLWERIDGRPVPRARGKVRKSETNQVPDFGSTPPASVTLGDLALSGVTVTANARVGDPAGRVTGAQSTSVLTMPDTSGGLFAVSGRQVVAAAPLAQGTYNVTVRETMEGATGSPRDTVLTVNVDASPTVTAPTLAVLTLPTASIAENAAIGAAVGPVQGRTTASTLSLADNAGGRFAINSVSGQITVASALDYETATSHQITVRETLAEATNSPRDTVLTITILAQDGAETATVISQSTAPALSSPVAGNTAHSAYFAGTPGAYTVNKGLSIKSITSQMRVGGVSVEGGLILSAGDVVAVQEIVTASDDTVASFVSSSVTVAESPEISFSSTADLQPASLAVGDTLTITKSTTTAGDYSVVQFTVSGVDRRADLVDNGATFTFDTTGVEPGEIQFQDQFVGSENTITSPLVTVSLAASNPLRTVREGGVLALRYTAAEVPATEDLAVEFAGGTAPLTFSVQAADASGNVTLTGSTLNVGSTVGPFAVTIRATDADGATADLDVDILTSAEAMAYDGGAPSRLYAIAGTTALSYDFDQHFSAGSGTREHTQTGAPAGTSLSLAGLYSGTVTAGLTAPALGVHWEAGQLADRRIYLEFFNSYTVPVGHKVFFDLQTDPNAAIATGTQMVPGQTFTGTYNWPVGSVLSFRLVLRRDSDGANIHDNRVTLTIEEASDPTPPPSGGGGGAGFTSADLGSGTAGLASTSLGADEFVGMSVHNDATRYTIFDAGSYRGLHHARILWRGTCTDGGSGTSGGIVQVEAWNGAAWVWSDVAVVQPDGSWSGWVQHWLRAGTYAPRLRFKDGTGTATLANKYGVGMLRLEHGQSNKYHWSYQDDQGSFAKPAVENGNCLFVAFYPTDDSQNGSNRSGPLSAGHGRVYRIDGSNLNYGPGVHGQVSGFLTGLPSAWRLIANSINRNFGGVPVAICPMDISGEGWDQFIQEQWAHFDQDKVQHAAMVLTDADRGQAFGMGSFQFSSGTSEAYADENLMGAALTGRRRDGTAIVKPEDVQSEKYQFNVTRRVAWSANELVDYNIGGIVLEGSSWTFNDEHVAASEAFKAIQRNTAYPLNPFNSFSPEQGWFRGYVNGENDGTSDTNHPARDTLYGGPLAGLQHFNGSVLAAGFYPQGGTQLDVIEKHPNGDTTKVRIGFSKAYATTMHLGMNRPRLSGRPDVKGFRMNGSLVDAWIEDDAGNLAKRGWVVIRKPSGITDADIRSIDFSVVFQSSSGTTDVANGWRVGHHLAVGFGVDGFTYASYFPLHADLFSNFEAYAPDHAARADALAYSYPPPIEGPAPDPGGGSGGTPSTNLRADIEALEDNPNVGAPAVVSGPKTFGVDSLPTGASLSGRRVIINGDDVELAGWSGPGYGIEVKGQRARIRECEISEFGEQSGLFRQIQVNSTAHDCVIEDTDITGSGSPAGNAKQAIYCSPNTSGTFSAQRGLIMRRLRISRQREDGLGLHGEFHLQYVDFRRHQHVPDGSAAWSPSASYSTGDFVVYNRLLYEALRSNSNAAPTGAKSNNADWRNHDLHCDTINVKSVTHPSVIEYFRIDPDDSVVTGMNASIWLAPDTNSTWPMNGGLLIQGGVLLPRSADALANPIKGKDTGQVFADIEFRHMWVGERSGFYWNGNGLEGGHVTAWDTMVDYTTGDPITGPAGADTTPTTPPAPVFP